MVLAVRGQRVEMDGPEDVRALVDAGCECPEMNPVLVLPHQPYLVLLRDEMCCALRILPSVKVSDLLRTGVFLFI